MTLEELIQQYRDGVVSAKDALAHAAPYLNKAATKKSAEAFVNEVIGLPSEPQNMTSSERALAKGWERNYRSK